MSEIAPLNSTPSSTRSTPQPADDLAESDIRKERLRVCITTLLKWLTIANPLQQTVPCLWPNGTFTNTFSLDDVPAGWDKSSWSWVNNRVDKNTIQNGKITYYYCQGI
jgi:hypothetical protein